MEIGLKHVGIALIVAVLALSLVLPFLGGSGAGGGSPASGNSNSAGLQAVLYKSSSCGCCGVFGSYLQGKGVNLQIVTQDDISGIKRKAGVPSALQSCHTTIIGDYFVEGHIPKEAIDKLLAEKPDIAGIAMPGMPSGSPGMPGAKQGPFVIYSVNNDGTYQEFMRI